MSAALPYRPDIDGLRAVAVLAVVLFHAKLGAISGGYVGVDIFFVISGYLITSIVVREIGEGTFSLADFYERRIRRIFPALFVVVFASLIAGWNILTPKDYADLAKSAMNTAIFMSNFAFNQTAGYFAPAAEAQPLLHTWSLAVEEQFYVIAPLALWFLYR
ncbi:MAG: acyltransferase, partial [Hyphomicrobium sp.]